MLTLNATRRSAVPLRDDPQQYVELQFETQEAANSAKKQLNGCWNTRPRSSSGKWSRPRDHDIENASTKTSAHGSRRPHGRAAASSHPQS